MEDHNSNIQNSILTGLLKTDFTQFENSLVAFRFIIRTVNKAFKVGRVSIWDLEEDRITSTCIFQEGKVVEMTEVLLEKDYPEYFKFMKRGLPLMVSNTFSNETVHELLESYLKPLNIHALLDIPIHEEGKPDGFLCFENLELTRDWTESEIYFGTLVTGLISLVNTLFKVKETERKLSEEKLLLKTIVDNVPLNVFVKDNNHKLILSNKEDQRYLGVKTEEEVIGKSDKEIFPSDVSKFSMFSLEQDIEILKTGKAVLAQKSFHVRPGDLSFRKYLVSKIPIIDDKQQVKGLIGIGQDITEHWTREAELKESEEKFRFIAENTTDGILVTENGFITYLSPSCERIMGFSFEEMYRLKRRELFDLIHPDDLEETRTLLDNSILEKKDNVVVRHRSRQKSGKYFWRENSVNYFYNSEGEVWRSIVLMRDITEAVLSEIKQKESEKLLGDILHSLDEAVWAIDFYSGTPIFISKSFESLFGYTLEDWRVNPNQWTEVIIEEDRYIVDRVFEDIKDRKFGPYTTRVRNEKGEIKWTENRGKVILDEEGKPKMLLGMAVDISEKVHALKDLEQSEKRLSLIMNSLDEVVWAVKLPSREPLFVSNSFEKVFGIPIEKWYDNYAVWSDYVTDEFREKESSMLQDLFKGGAAHGVLQIKDENGDFKWLECSAKYVYNEKNELDMMLGISVDITEQMEAEEKLKSSERNLSDILNALDEAVWAASIPDYKPLFVSKSFEDFYGFDLAAWKEDWQLWEKAIHPEDRHLISGFKDKVWAYEMAHATGRIVNGNGNVRWVENIAKTIFDEKGEPYMVLGIAVDITDKKRDEKKLNEVREQAHKAEMAKAELELKTLQMQMNPHFIFNSLNSIQSFILKNDVVSTNDYLSKFARLIRSFLDSSRSVSIRLGDEVKLLKLYVEMELMRFGDKFIFNVTIDKEVDKMLEIPSMMLQPFVENAINHGIRYKKGQGLLSVSFHKEGDYILCKIEDDGVGRLKSKEILENTNKGYISQGLKITAERFEAYNAINKTNINYCISDLNELNEDVGTSVKIHFPITKFSVESN